MDLVTIGKNILDNSTNVANVTSILGFVLASVAYGLYKKQKHDENEIETKYLCLEKSTDLISSLYEYKSILLFIMNNSQNGEKLDEFLDAYEYRRNDVFDSMATFQSDIDCMMELIKLSDNLSPSKTLEEGYREFATFALYFPMDSLFVADKRNKQSTKLDSDILVEKFNLACDMMLNLLCLIRPGSTFVAKSWRKKKLEAYAEFIEQSCRLNENSSFRDE